MESAGRASIGDEGRSERPESAISTVTSYFDKRASAESNITLQPLTKGFRDVKTPESMVHPFLNSNVQFPPDTDMASLSLELNITGPRAGTAATEYGADVLSHNKDEDAKSNTSVEPTALPDVEQASKDFRPWNPDKEERVFAKGLTLHLLTIAIGLSLFLSTLEVTIVSTSLVSITNALNGFDKSSWIVTSYLLTYTGGFLLSPKNFRRLISLGFLLLFAKFSDIFGRKVMLLLALLIFVAFSCVCGASQSMLQLIIMRAFQGIGGAGIYSMVMVIAPDMIPQEKYALYTGVLSSVFALSSVLGPVIGGFLSSGGPSTWRWVFLLNAPAGAVAITLVTLLLPWSFPYPPKKGKQVLKEAFSRRSIKRLDLLGAFMVLAASVLLVFALEEAGNDYAWKSVPIITSFAGSGVLWLTFFGWEWSVSRRAESAVEPVYPWRLVKDRFFVGMMLNTLCVGYPFMSLITINLPQRFQTVSALGPSQAGLRLLPLVVCSPIASATAGLLVTKFKISPVYLMFIAGSLQITGIMLMSTISTTNFTITAAQYGYEAIMGLGFGLSLSVVLVMVPLFVEKKDMASAMGALTQIRVLGGTIGIAVSTTIQNNHVGAYLPTFLNPAQISAIMTSSRAIEHLRPDLATQVRQTYAVGYNRQTRVMVFVVAGELASLLLLWSGRKRKL